MLSVTDSLLCKADNRLVSLLTLLDQSAAFDTIDHKILLNRFSYSFGISGTVFKWFISYLTNRTQSVSVGDLNSLPLPLKYGVPQGSVLGPILFTLYSQPVSDKIREHNISYQKLADDTQLYKTSQPTELQSLASDFESCFLSVKAWMLSNKLKLDDEKTEAISFFHLACAVCSGRTVQNKILFRKFLLFRLCPSQMEKRNMHVQFSHKHNIAHLQLNKNS